MRGRPKAPLILSEADHEQLTALTMRRKTAEALALRARIVLACAEGTGSAQRARYDSPSAVTSFQLRRYCCATAG